MRAQDFMVGAVPEDITLGVLRGYILRGEIAEQLRQMSRGGDVRVRFLWRDDSECPDEMTIGEFREHAAAGRAHIAIDDGSGGLRVLEDA